jgi:hypothetical protein
VEVRLKFGIVVALGAFFGLAVGPAFADQAPNPSPGVPGKPCRYPCDQQLQAYASGPPTPLVVPVLTPSTDNIKGTVLPSTHEQQSLAALESEPRPPVQEQSPNFLTRFNRFFTGLFGSGKAAPVGPTVLVYDFPGARAYANAICRSQDKMAEVEDVSKGKTTFQCVESAYNPDR